MILTLSPRKFKTYKRKRQRQWEIPSSTCNQNNWFKYTYMEYFQNFPKNIIWNTAQKMKFSIKDFFSKCDQIRKKLRIWSHLLKKSLMDNFIFNEVEYINYYGVCWNKMIMSRIWTETIELKEQINKFLLIPAKVKICFQAVSHNSIFITIAVFNRSFVFIWTQFWRPFIHRSRLLRSCYSQCHKLYCFYLL